MLTLPSRIMNYRVSSASPTDELLTLGQILSEIGDYAGTILDREHLSLSKRCAARLKKVVGELVARKRINSTDDLYDIPATAVAATDLSSMTISELYTLYRGWPVRHRQRQKDGREHLTFYYEGKIVRELQSRKPVGREEQLKIDYCVATYRNELDNMSFIFSLPVRTGSDKEYPAPAGGHTPGQVAKLIRKYSNCRDIIGREILIEYVDIALDLFKDNPSQPMPELLAALSDLRQRDKICIPTL